MTVRKASRRAKFYAKQRRERAVRRWLRDAAEAIGRALDTPGRPWFTLTLKD